jgi:tetratricopeptide (TPR) repeat protein
MVRRRSAWIVGSLLGCATLFAAPDDSGKGPEVDFTKPPDMVDVFQQERLPMPKPEARGDQVVEPIQSVIGSTLDSLGRIDHARRLVELGDALASSGDLDLARSAYSEAKQLAPGSRYDGLASQKLQALDAQQLIGAGEAEAGLTLTGELCWNCLSQVEPALKVKWLDQAFEAYSQAVDEKKPKEMALYRQVIKQLSPETLKHLDELKPREINAVVRWKVFTVTYSRDLEGKQSLGFGLGFNGK